MINPAIDIIDYVNIVYNIYDPARVVLALALLALELLALELLALELLALDSSWLRARALSHDFTMATHFERAQYITNGVSDTPNR